MKNIGIKAKQRIKHEARGEARIAKPRINQIRNKQAKQKYD